MKEIIQFLIHQILTNLTAEEGKRFKEVHGAWLDDDCFDLDQSIINDLNITDKKLKEMLSILEKSYHVRNELDTALEKAEKYDQIRSALK